MEPKNGLTKKLEVGVHLPGTRGVSRQIPSEMLGASVDRAIRYVIDGQTTDDDKGLSAAIQRELGLSSAYSVFVAKDSEQYKTDQQQPLSKLFEVDPTTHEPQYRKVNVVVSSPRQGGW